MWNSPYKVGPNRRVRNDNQHGPFKILAIGPTAASNTPDNRPDKLFFLGLASDLSGRDSTSRVPVKRCEPRQNPDDSSDITKHLPADLTTYVLTASSAKSPPLPRYPDDVTPPPERLQV